MLRRLSGFAVLSIALSACATGQPSETGSGTLTGSGTTHQSAEFGASVKMERTNVQISPEISKDFTLDEATNLDTVVKHYGLTFTPDEKRFFNEHKFLLKTIPDSTIKPDAGDRSREFADLYFEVAGLQKDYKERSVAHAPFYSTDVFLHQYNLIYTELLKEMENTAFFPQMQAMMKTLFDDAQKNLASAKGEEVRTWTEVRDYLAVSHAIFATVQTPSPDSFFGGVVPDDKSDTYENAAAFAKTLKLGTSEAAVLKDLEQIYAAKELGKPETLKASFDEYSQIANTEFKMDFSQFTPRSHYTSSVLRREYFRGMNWIIQVPFFLKSPQLTKDAYALTELLEKQPKTLEDYRHMDSAINFLVGTSDDLTIDDYIAASTKGDAEAQMKYLAGLHNPKIKSLSAAYPTVGDVQTEDTINATKGLRLFSGKFIIDSGWTQQLTQGDEAPKPGYTQKLPPMPSGLEVMTLLGSDAAKQALPMFSFYTEKYSQAIDQALKELQEDEAKMTEADWQQNVYMACLWTLKGMFEWMESNVNSLPRFAQSPLWATKTLQTASGFWTEMRHATLLYAKQSFAELGGGGGTCDTRKIPDPPKGYVEPNIEAFDRILYVAKKTQAGITELGFEDLDNMMPLESYIDLIIEARAIAVEELKNVTWSEQQTSSAFTYEDENGVQQPCTEYSLKDGSGFERVRLLAQKIAATDPVPVEGPILPAKDHRAALVADIHTGQDSDNPLQILYEATGVPQLILVAVKDSNGPRVTVGFTYSHYEFMQPYGGNRMTDEDWQKNFYVSTGDPMVDDYEPYVYTDKETWPLQPKWYDALWAK